MNNYSYKKTVRTTSADGKTVEETIETSEGDEAKKKIDEAAKATDGKFAKIDRFFRRIDKAFKDLW